MEKDRGLKKYTHINIYTVGVFLSWKLFKQLCQVKWKHKTILE